MTILGKFFPFTFSTTIFTYLIVAVLFFVSIITITPNDLSSISFIFDVFGQVDDDKEKERIIGFGGNNPDEKINTNSNGSVPTIGEINNFNSHSEGLKILVTLNNISNLLEIDNINISKNLFLKVEESNSFSPESVYLSYKFKKSDFDDSNFKFITSINKLLLIDSNNDDFENESYLTEINGSNISNYTEKQISGNNVLHIDGFEFNEKNKKIYAFGNYDYLKGSDYDIKYGLAEEHNDHMLFVIDPITVKIIDSVKLWSGREEGDESTIGNIFINYNDNELYVTALGEGELDEIFVIDINDLNIKSVISTNDFSNQWFYGDTIFDDINNIFYMCNSDSIIGVSVDERTIVKNISSIYCPL